MKSILSVVSALTAVLRAKVARGAPLEFFGEDLDFRSSCGSHPNSDTARADFLSYLNAYHTESFESFAASQEPPLTLPFDDLPFDALLTAPGYARVFGAFCGGCPIDGSQFLAHFTATGPASIVFDEPVAAFGFYGVDIGNVGGSIMVNTVSGETKNFPVPHTVVGNQGAAMYYALIDLEDPFTSVELENTGSFDNFMYDMLTVATPSEVFQVYFDIKPGNCPNAFNRKSKGVLPTAIVGTETFDVTDIDVDSIRLCALESDDVDCIDPIRSSVEDVATPCIACASTGGCNLDGADSYPDLTIKFDSKDVAPLLASASKGDSRPLEIRFSSYDGDDFSAADSVKIVK